MTQEEILEEKPDINNKGEVYERQMRAIQEELEPQLKNIAVSYYVEGDEDAYISFDAYLRIQIPENRMIRSFPNWEDHQAYRKIKDDIDMANFKSIFGDDVWIKNDSEQQRMIFDYNYFTEKIKK